MRGMQDTCPDTHRNIHIYVRMLHDACLKLGGEHKLAVYLGVDASAVDDWLNGRGRPPDSIFLLCLDLVQRPAVAG
jgi:DNA-binding transcriptional regulator YiaG